MNSRLLLAIYILTLTSGCRNQKHSSEVFFPNKEVKLGEIEYKCEIVQKFVFFNKTNYPLFIEAIISTCECTKPMWSRDTIMPGLSGEIFVEVTTNRIGSFRQPIVVYFNGHNPPDTLSIEGYVSTKNIETEFTK